MLDMIFSSIKLYRKYRGGTWLYCVNLSDKHNLHGWYKSNNLPMQLYVVVRREVY